MPDYVRVATFDADAAALDALIEQINLHDGPPEGVPSTAITVLTDRSTGKLRVVARFGSEEDLKAGSKVLDAMNPPDDSSMRRLSVEAYEVVLERQAP
jgi:hypothetical protein